MVFRPLIVAIVGALIVPWAAVEAAPSVLSVASELEIDEPVDGDVVALGADLVLGPGAVVTGHAVSIFGEVHVAPGARVEGRVIALSSLASLTVDRVDGRQGRRVDLGVKMLVAGGWLLATTLVAFLWPTRVRRASTTLPGFGWRTVALGLLVALTLVAALIAALGLGPLVGVPVAVAIALAFTAGKALGLAVLGAALGSAILQRLIPSRVHPVTTTVFVGVVGMLVVRFLPVVGGGAWTVLVVVCLGAAVSALITATQPSTATPAGSPH
jgi:hypothetical protein